MTEKEDQGMHKPERINPAREREIAARRRTGPAKCDAPGCVASWSHVRTLSFTPIDPATGEQDLTLVLLCFVCGRHERMPIDDLQRDMPTLADIFDHADSGSVYIDLRS